MEDLTEKLLLTYETYDISAAWRYLTCHFRQTTSAISGMKYPLSAKTGSMTTTKALKAAFDKHREHLQSHNRRCGVWQWSKRLTQNCTGHSVISYVMGNHSVVEGVTIQVNFHIVPWDCSTCPVLIGNDILNCLGITYIRNDCSSKIYYIYEPCKNSVSEVNSVLTLHSINTLLGWLIDRVQLIRWAVSIRYLQSIKKSLLTQWISFNICWWYYKPLYQNHILTKCNLKKGTYLKNISTQLQFCTYVFIFVNIVVKVCR